LQTDADLFVNYCNVSLICRSITPYIVLWRFLCNEQMGPTKTIYSIYLFSFILR